MDNESFEELEKSVKEGATILKDMDKQISDDELIEITKHGTELIENVDYATSMGASGAELAQECIRSRKRIKEYEKLCNTMIDFIHPRSKRMAQDFAYRMDKITALQSEVNK